MSCIFAEVESPTQALVLQPLKTLNYETFFYRASDACSGDESSFSFMKFFVSCRIVTSVR